MKKAEEFLAEEFLAEELLVEELENFCIECDGKGIINCEYCLEGCTFCGYIGYVFCKCKE